MQGLCQAEKVVARARGPQPGSSARKAFTRGQQQDPRELRGTSRAGVFLASNGSRLTHASPSAGAPRRAGRSGWRDPPVISAPGGLRTRAATVPHACCLCRRGLSASLLPAALPAAAAALWPGPRRHRRLSAPGRGPLRRSSTPGTAAAPAGRLGRAPRCHPRPRRAARLAGATRPRSGPRPAPGLCCRGAPAPAQPRRRRARPGRCSPWSSWASGAPRPGGTAGETRRAGYGPGWAAIEHPGWKQKKNDKSRIPDSSPSPQLSFYASVRKSLVRCCLAKKRP